MAHGIKEVGIGKDTTEDALVISQQEEAYRRTCDDGRDELGPSGAKEVVARWRHCGWSRTVGRNRANNEEGVVLHILESGEDEPFVDKMQPAMKLQSSPQDRMARAGPGIMTGGGKRVPHAVRARRGNQLPHKAI